MIQKIKIDLIEGFDNVAFNGPVPEDIRQLADSIKEQGLFHPILVQRMNKNGKYLLSAGHRRLHALIYLGESWVEASVFTEDAKTLVEMEILGLHENLQRHNLPWHEEVVLTKKLHELRQSQKGLTAEALFKRGGDTTKKKEWTMRDTADELGIALGKVSTDIQLAAAIASNPSLKNIKDKETAMKMIKTVKKQNDAMEDVAYVAPKVDVNQVMLGNSLQLLKFIPDATFHACITDPPWLNFLGDVKYKRVENETLQVFKEIYRVLKYNSFLYVFLGMDDYTEYVEVLKSYGFSLQKYPLIWHKPNIISRGTRSWEYGRDYEFILIAVKGSPAKITSGQESAVITVNAIHPTLLKHPHEKPVTVIERLISDCVPQGGLILDAFGGSGVLGSACKNTLRNYYIIEKEKDFYDQIVKRLS